LARRLLTLVAVLLMIAAGWAFLVTPVSPPLTCCVRGLLAGATGVELPELHAETFRLEVETASGQRALAAHPDAL